jgi:hypothetical protein
MPKAENSSSPWIQALCRAVGREADVVPPGFKDIKAIAAEIRRSERRAYAIVNKVIQNGGCEVKTLRVVIDGRLRPVKHYCLKRGIQLQ